MAGIKAPQTYLFWLLSSFLLLPGITLAQSPLEVAGAATATASASGNWSAASTWGGAIPSTNARVLIPAGITVTVDSVISAEFKSVRIEGTLNFRTDVETELRTEYLVSGPTGRLEIGTASAPIQAGVNASVVFADLGGTNTAEDPERFAPGAVLMGPVEMRGAEKTAFTTLAVHPAAGTQTLSLASAPAGWNSSDQLVVAGTIPGDFTSDEVVTIQSITL